MSQLYKLDELRTYNAAEMIKKGVDGNPGKTIPRTPKPKDILPIAIYVILSIFTNKNIYFRITT